MPSIQHEGITLHDHPVDKGTGITLVGIANDVFLVGRRIQHRLPLDTGREGGTSAPPEAGLGNGLDELLTRHLQGDTDTLKSPVFLVFLLSIRDR